MQFRLHLRSLIIAMILFLIEVLIALFVHDNIIRPYIGDTLVVILIYYFCKAFVRLKPGLLITAVLLFAYTVEIAQYFNLVKHLGLERSRFWTIVIGNSFHWLDMLAYSLGAVCLYLVECYFSGKQVRNTV